jgi:2-keto-4-pentenoate hydratase/2-oxohepta-3-ene-1,7-dioic acid hydratase in catechol pathway
VLGKIISNIYKEIGATPPEKPLWFLKPPSALIGPGDPIIFPRMANRVDYEGELAIVIKTTMKNVNRNDALKYVLGYSCFNDVTERKLAPANPFNLAIAKSFDTFAALGPYIETELDPDHVQLKTYLNGKLMQDDNTSSCVFDAAYLLEYLSHCLTLFPGDVISTGTPKGIAPMSPGDVVDVEIEGIGKLSNPVESEK